MLRQYIVLVLLAVSLHQSSADDEAVVDCMTDLAHNVFSGIFSSFNSANRRQGKSMTVEDLRILIEQELERIERGEVVEIIPSIVEMIQLIVKEMMGANRRSHSCLEELVNIGMGLITMI